jgi:hypothetical protein
MKNGKSVGDEIPECEATLEKQFILLESFKRRQQRARFRWCSVSGQSNVVFSGFCEAILAPAARLA